MSHSRLPSPRWTRREFLSTAGKSALGLSLGIAREATAQQIPPLYTAIDLHPRGVGESRCVAAYGGQQVGYARQWPGGYGDSYALLWSGTANSARDLTPNGSSDTIAVDIFAGQQVGTGGRHALLWTGKAQRVVDLHPTQLAYIVSSSASGTSGNQQVGSGAVRTPVINSLGDHALLWFGTPDSAVDLHPPGFATSAAFATTGSQQVGFGLINSTNFEHALLWSGSALSVIDLHPPGYYGSMAFDASGNQQVGTGLALVTDRPLLEHALLWYGTPTSAVDLNPPGVAQSEARGTNGAQQVGWTDNGGSNIRAALWSGSAESHLDLHSFLPPGFQLSFAHGIDAQGNVVGCAQEAAAPFTYHAILWQRN